MGNSCPGPLELLKDYGVPERQCLADSADKDLQAAHKKFEACLGEINKKLKKNIDNTALKKEQDRVAAHAQKRQERAQARAQAQTTNSSEEQSNEQAQSNGGYRSKGKRRPSRKSSHKSSHKSSRRTKKRRGTKRQVR